MINNHCAKHGVEVDEDQKERWNLSVSDYAKIMNETVDKVVPGMSRREWKPLIVTIQQLVPIENAGYPFYEDKLPIYRRGLRTAMTTRYPLKKDELVDLTEKDDLVDLTSTFDEDSSESESDCE